MSRLNNIGVQIGSKVRLFDITNLPDIGRFGKNEKMIAMAGDIVTIKSFYRDNHDSEIFMMKENIWAWNRDWFEVI